VTKHNTHDMVDPQGACVLLAAGQPMESIRANIKLAISGGQNEPRDAISGTVWALLTHPDQLALLREENRSGSMRSRNMRAGSRRSGCRRRRVARPWSYGGVDFGAGGSGVLHVRLGKSPTRPAFSDPDRFDITRNTAKSIAFGAGPHSCAGAFASRAMVAMWRLPSLFKRLRNLRLDQSEPSDRRLGVSRAAEFPVIWDR